MCFHSASDTRPEAPVAGMKGYQAVGQPAVRFSPWLRGQQISSSYILRVKPVVPRNWVSVVRFWIFQAIFGVNASACSMAAAQASPEHSRSSSNPWLSWRRPWTCSVVTRASGNVLHVQTGSVISEPEPQQPEPDTPTAACQQQATSFMCCIHPW